MTTNNLIGYDPLAWMEGDAAESEVESPVKPVRKSTKSKAKVEPVEIDEDVTEPEIIEDALDEFTVASEAEVIENDVEIDISVHEDSEVEIKIDANESVDVVVEIAVETEASEPENDVLEASVEDISETPEETVPEVDVVTEEIIEPLVELGTEASLKTLSTLYETFKRVLAAHDVIEINASDVTTVDTATFQLLVSLKKDAPSLNKTINIIYPSERFIESAKLLDLLTILEITE